MTDPALHETLGRGGVMGQKADEYRKSLEECEQLAEAATTPEMKKAYQDMAAKWRALLELAERQGW